MIKFILESVENIAHRLLLIYGSPQDQQIATQVCSINMKYNFNNNQIMIERNRQSNHALKNHRKYVRRNSPEKSAIYFQPAHKSSEQVLQQFLPRSHKSNNRYNSYTNNCQSTKASAQKFAKKENSYVNYQFLGISKSKNFIQNKEKRGKSSYHKKINNLNSSQIFFLQNKLPATKQASKGSCPSDVEISLQKQQNQIEQLHYNMVQFHQKCKRAIQN